MAAVAQADQATWVELDEVDSTNTEATRRALAGARGPLYVRAERQTAGRGRSGRVWAAPSGNLALSWMGRMRCPPDAIPQLSLVAGLAVFQALAEALKGSDQARNLQIKWPNDVLLDGAKLAGILVEATQVAGEQIAVIGIGINVAHAPEVSGRRTAALAAAGVRVPSLRDMARLVARHLEAVLARWDEGRGFDAVRRAWLAAATPKGTPMTVETRAGRVSGCFDSLAADGALILTDSSGGMRSYSYGDVTLDSEREMP